MLVAEPLKMLKVQTAALLADSIGSHISKLSIRCSRGLKTTGRQFCQKADKEVAPRGTPYNKLSIGVPKEIYTNERRVALVPAAVQVMNSNSKTLYYKDCSLGSVRT